MASSTVQPSSTVLKQLGGSTVEHRALQAPSRQGVSVSRFTYEAPDFGITKPNAPADVYMAVMHLRPMERSHREWDAGGHERVIPPVPLHGFRFRDYRETKTLDLSNPFDTVNIFLPRRAIREVTDELHLPEIAEMTWGPDHVIEDAPLAHLTHALLPYLAKPEEVDLLFTEHLFSAMMVHLIRSYSPNSLQIGLPKGGLPPWIEKRAKELMLSRLSSKISLTELAEACDLSPSHFGRSFRLTTGLSPYNWLRQERIRAAQDLLLYSSLSLVDVALATGFATQSHFANAFKAVIGVAPGVWRRIRAS